MVLHSQIMTGSADFNRNFRAFLRIYLSTKKNYRFDCEFTLHCFFNRPILSIPKRFREMREERTQFESIKSF